MSQSVTVAAGEDCLVGYYGKIPARGDFVRWGLPSRFVDPWDAWVRQAIAESRAFLADDWLAAWLEAPIWNFAFVPDVCGPHAVVGVWMPSVDRIGRYFPLTVAMLGDERAGPDLARACGGFLAAARGACLEAIEHDLSPEELAARVVAASLERPGIAPPQLPPGAAVWWTEGAPRVPPTIRAGDGLPDPRSFAAMLDASGVATEGNPAEPER